MSYVYFLQADMPDGLIKLGLAEDPKGRMEHFRAVSPVPLKLLYFTEGTAKLLKQLHVRFHDVRQHGAWFTPTPSLLDYIRVLQEVESTEGLMTVSEAASLLRTTEACLRQLCKSGELIPIYTPGGHRRFREESIRALLEPGTIFDHRRSFP